LAVSEAFEERRLIGRAVIELMAEQGYEGLTAAAIAAQAGVERAAFERCFPDVHACVLQVYWECTDEFTSLVFSAFEAEDRWRDGFRAAAYTAARYVRDNPRVVRFGTVQMFGAGLMAQAQRESHLQRMVDLIDAGRQELDDPDSVGRGVAEAAFGSIYEMVVKEVQAGRGTGSAEDFVPDLMYLAVRPYLGHDVAREELSIAPPPELRSAAWEPSIQTRTQRRHVVHGPAAPRYGPPVTKAGPAGDDAALRLAKLPPGRHGLPREFVTRNQRDRLAAGTIAVGAERGFNAATITQICAAAGVSRRTFYAYFSSKEECFFAAYDTIAEHLRIATDAAAAERTEWPAKVGAKLEATLDFLAANPDLARFCLIAPRQAGEGVADRYRTAMDKVVVYLCEGMPPPPATKAPSEAIAGSLIGGMVALVVRKVNAGEGDDLPQLLPDLLELFLTPYLGRAEALQVASG
jgi:AcrR family transcriptional regulator